MPSRYYSIVSAGLGNLTATPSEVGQSLKKKSSESYWSPHRLQLRLKECPIDPTEGQSPSHGWVVETK